jgi:1,4-dihydroxy-2-naphthoate octaprenyltransferase
MSVVNISGLSPAFFITVAVFLMFILSMLSLGILRMFQLRKRSGIVFFVLGVIGIAVFSYILASGMVPATK